MTGRARRPLPRLYFIPGFALLVAAATAPLGWWALPAAGVLAGALLPREVPLFLAVALGGALGWALLVVLDALLGEAAGLADAAGAVLGMPGPGFVALTVLFAALVPACAAVSVQYFRRLAAHRRETIG